MANRVHINGSDGEGGGQVLRTALALSLVTGRPFQIEQIRGKRKKPGLLRQHLTAVRAAVEIGGAEVSGAELSSTTLAFTPAGLARAGTYRFSVGSAGSATLVFQTVLPALLGASGRSELMLEGGTHNPQAPPFDFLQRTFLPQLRVMGARADIRIERHGFYPAGGGSFTATIEPWTERTPLRLLTRGETTVRAIALLATLSHSIAKRELTVVRNRLGIDRESCRIEYVRTSLGPGNALLIEMESADACEVVTSFGLKSVSAERVASAACDEAMRYLVTDAPVGAHLADQLLLPMALAGGGEFRTVTPTPHSTTNARVISQFLDVSVTFEQDTATTAIVRVKR